MGANFTLYVRQIEVNMSFVSLNLVILAAAMAGESQKAKRGIIYNHSTAPSKSMTYCVYLGTGTIPTFIILRPN